ncbi:MAG TPA: NRDE family protein [Candidatus Dormibacteraeota bacterium]|jgi:uncharacterized protein with NRDE domain|nr:NRDE family protein [Candidatus Dormibacteraeota bacterium]
MCTILLAFQHVAGAPVVVAANRDEYLQRPSLPPHLLRSHPVVAGGSDQLAGGTWMAVRGDGVVAAVTNRRASTRDPQRRSRGELPIALLDTADDAAAHALLDSLDPEAYNPFNALYMSPECAVVAEADTDGLRVRVLEPGLHVLTVFDVDDRSHAKVDALSTRFHDAARAHRDGGALLAAMEDLLRDHGVPGRDGVDAACVHLDEYGTVSSSSVVVDDRGGIVYRHAPGKPCVTPHDDVSALVGAGTPASHSSSG